MTRIQLLQYAYIGICHTISTEKERAKCSYKPETAQARLEIAEKHFTELTTLMQKAYEKSQPE